MKYILAVLLMIQLTYVFAQQNVEHVTGVRIHEPVSDATETATNAELSTIEERLTTKIAAYTNCLKSNEYTLSKVTNLIFELRKVHTSVASFNTQNTLKDLFNIYKSLGGIAERSEQIEQIVNPCLAIADGMNDDVEAEVAAQNSARLIKEAEGTNVFQTPTIDFSGCKKPKYPMIPIWLDEGGSVRIAFLMGAHGIVNFSFVAKSSGVMILDDTALEAFSKCQFSPATTNGNSTPSWLFIDYVFEM